MTDDHQRPESSDVAQRSVGVDGRPTEKWKVGYSFCALIIFCFITLLCAIEISRWREQCAEQAMLNIGSRVEYQQTSAWMPERYGRRVVSLNLTDANEHWPALIDSFVKSCPNLKTISLFDRELTDAECGLLIAMSPERLELDHCTLPPTCWPIFRQSQIQELSLNYVQQLDDAAIQELARMPRLRSLDLSGTPITDQGMKRFALAPPAFLEELAVAGTSISDEGVKAIAQLFSLRRLDLSETLVTDEAMVSLSRLPHLQELILKWNSITGDRLDALTSCHSLRVLSLAKTYRIGGGRKPPPLNLEWELDIKALMEESRERNAQGELFFFGANPAPRGRPHSAASDLSWYEFDLRGLPSLPHLERLDLAGLHFRDQQALNRVSHCPALQELDLRDTNIDHNGIAAIHGAASLHTLYLSRTGIDDSMLRCLTLLPSLRFVSLKGSKVTKHGLQLFLQDPKIKVLLDE